jgi:hypothetical protein
VGVLDYWPRDSTDLVVVGGAIYSPMHDRKWDLMTAAQSAAPFAAGADVTFRQQGCSCLVGAHSFAFGGGGDGVTGAWAEQTYLNADFNLRALTSHAQPFSAHAVACVTVNQHCWVIGGVTSQSGPLGSTAVRVFDPTTGSFVVGSPLPIPTAQAGAAVGAGTLLVAGGYCSGGGSCPASNDPSGQPATVLSSVLALDLTKSTWQPAPSLPRPVTGAGMVFLAGRFYLVGGAASAYGPINPNGVLSWTQGESGWRADANAPGTGPVVAVLADGQAIFAAIAEANFEYHLYRAAP